MNKIRLDVDEIQIGAIVRLSAGRGTKTRRVYKVVSRWWPHQNKWFSELWTIPVMLDSHTGEWQEECALIGNMISKFNKIYLCEDGKWVEHPLEIVERPAFRR